MSVYLHIISHGPFLFWNSSLLILSFDRWYILFDKSQSCVSYICVNDSVCYSFEFYFKKKKLFLVIFFLLLRLLQTSNVLMHLIWKTFFSAWSRAYINRVFLCLFFPAFSRAFFPRVPSCFLFHFVLSLLK